MTDAPFYGLRQPTVWAPLPKTFSFSSLQGLKGCPRRWQFIRSAWGEYDRFPERPQPAAIEGGIIHEALDLLAKEVGRCGRPAIESKQFARALARSKFWEFFADQVNAWNARLKTHPRAGPRYVLRTSPRDLANQTVRLFREQYQPSGEHADVLTEPTTPPEPTASGPDLLSRLHARRALTELQLRHPSLPLTGVLDMVSVDDTGVTTIVDFKTGVQKPAHEEQLRIYAMLWWRVTGEQPGRVAVQYLDTRWQESVSERDLIAAESAVVDDIRRASEELVRRPAAARTGHDCQWCPVRARCDEGWTWVQQSKGQATGIVSLQVAVASEPTDAGFLATRDDLEEVAIVFDSAVSRMLPPLGPGDRLRIVDAVLREKGKEVQLLPWTEVYVL